MQTGSTNNPIFADFLEVGSTNILVQDGAHGEKTCMFKSSMTFLICLDKLLRFKLGVILQDDIFVRLCHYR
jgi:hypothetical protein